VIRLARVDQHQRLTTSEDREGERERGRQGEAVTHNIVPTSVSPFLLSDVHLFFVDDDEVEEQTGRLELDGLIPTIPTIPTIHTQHQPIDEQPIVQHLKINTRTGDDLQHGQPRHRVPPLFLRLEGGLVWYCVDSVLHQSLLVIG
jgi:hypothetical protein